MGVFGTGKTKSGADRLHRRLRTYFKNADAFGHAADLESLDQIEELDRLQRVAMGTLAMDSPWDQIYTPSEFETLTSSEEVYKLYAESFRYRGMNRDEWMRYRLDTLGARTVVGLKLDDVLLLQDPRDKSLYLARFRQTLIDDKGPVVTIKRLYWRRGNGGVLRIVAEDNG